MNLSHRGMGRLHCEISGTATIVFGYCGQQPRRSAIELIPQLDLIKVPVVAPVAGSASHHIPGIDLDRNPNILR
jgi:hypothetical protein